MIMHDTQNNDQRSEPAGMDDELDDEQYIAEIDETESVGVNESHHLASEPLFSVLLRRATETLDPDDTVLHDYVQFVAPRLSEVLAHKTAKGGDFVIDKHAAGVSEEQLRRYGDDQSMRAHLINGLFPVARVAKLLTKWGVLQFRQTFDDATYRLFCAGYTLHDWLKLPDVDAELVAHGLNHATVNAATHLPVVEQIIKSWCMHLGLDQFLVPLGPLDDHLHSLVYIACNTQVKWGTMRNLAALPKLDEHRRANIRLATDLSNLADLLAYVGRTPIETARHPTIGTLLDQLSNGAARLTYHHIAEVRGILTNLINNAAVAAYKHPYREPILFAPTGVVYLEWRSEAPPAPEVSVVAEATIEHIRATCRANLSANLTGFRRDGKGLKYAPFYHLFFSPREFAALVAQAAYRRTMGKASAAPTRYAKMQTAGMIPSGGQVDLPADITVDMLAEGCALLEKVLEQHVTDLDAQVWLLEHLGVSDIAPQVTEIPQLGNTGGVPYQWYYAAGIVHQRNLGLSPQEWQERLVTIAAAASDVLPDALTGGGWNELRTYVESTVRFEKTVSDQAALTAMAQRELEQYSGARKLRNSTLVCSLCSSAYSISEQREAAILFAPMVYTNKQPLHGNRALRNICAICEMEMMLRQLLMNRSSAVGGKFEAQRLRYLFLYPTYFFTPETLEVLRLLTLQLQNISFTALRKLLVPEHERMGLQANLQLKTFQQIEDLLLDPTLVANPAADRWLRYSGKDPATFTLIGIKPGRDAKDAEAWIQPAFLALVLPLLIDVKVVASESMLPIFNEATELPETVAFDGPHQFVTYLTRRNRINLDQLGPALQRLTTTYLIHLDGNAKRGGSGYDYRWQDIPVLARNLDESPLYAFAYLKKWQRRTDLDSFGADRAALYREYFAYLAPKGDQNMTHAEELVRLYRQFYRHARGKLNTNSILRPLSIISTVVLEANLQFFDSDDALVQVAQGRLESFIDGIEKKRGADGTIPGWIEPDQRQQALQDFCTYFVKTVYRDAFARNRAALRGKQMNLIKNACEAVYLDMQRREWAERNESSESRQPTDVDQPVLDL